MGKLRFTGWLYNMTLDEAVHFFSRIVGNLLNIGVAPLALNFGMHTLVKNVLVHIKQTKVTVLVNSAEAGIFVTQKTIADISGIRIQRCEKQEQHQT